MSRLTIDEILTLLEPLTRELDSKALITQSHPDYGLHVIPFSTKKDLRPPVVTAPSETEALAKVIGFLYKSKLDFHIRGQGFGSPSAQDVMVSLLRFTSFEYDSTRKLATIGTGATWVKVAKNMQQVDPGHSVAVARTPSVGVGGSILHGGYSWMTSEFGCISDPVNFIDAEVVKYDGTVTMASAEPDLLWALRGSGGGFGVMTKAIVRAHPYSTAIWSGMILIPRKDLREMAQLMVDFISKPQHPKVNCLAYLVQEFMYLKILNEEQLRSVEGDMLALHVFDGCGETHGREAFKWALDMRGSIDLTTVTDMKGVVDMQRLYFTPCWIPEPIRANPPWLDNVASLRSTMTNFRALPLAIADLDVDTIVRTIEWHDKVRNVDPQIHGLTMTVLELLVFCAPIGGISEVAWPRPLDSKHYILIITGSPADGTEEQEGKARNLILNAPQQILRDRDFVVMPPGLDDLQDPKKTYNLHWDRLVKLRKRYDPKLRFKAIINP
ncbi:hypothetical protein LB504_010717 [Fusarium proliferatum]|nr:hypothetical protein LB504_010717 [Fusarium proliferatum]